MASLSLTQRPMDTHIAWLRVSYWTGAAADGWATVRMLFPQVAHDDPYRYALGLGASLMLAWTLLLLWADRKPMDRKGVLLLTACPLITGLGLAEVFALRSGLIDAGKASATLALLTGLFVLFVFSYGYARWQETRTA